MAILSPSLLAAKPLAMLEDVREAEKAGAKWLHVDVMDGSFVPNFSFGYSTVSALRGATELFLDVHLMVSEPIRYIEKFCTAGADMLTIHLESDSAENTAVALKKIKSLGVKCGLSIKPATPASALVPYLELCDMILVMTVEPGFGGQSFMTDMMPKVKELRALLDKINPHCYIQVDGGVDAKTAPICKENGANVLVAGTAFFKAENKAETLRLIEE